MLFLLAQLIAFLSGATDFKVADIQGVEVVAMLALAASLMSTRHRFVLTGPTVIVGLIPRFVLLVFLVLVGSLLSMRLQLYPIPETGVFKQPPFATFARFVEVVISVSSMFIVGLAIGTDPMRLRRILAAYVWCAYAGCVWAIVSFAGWMVGVKLPGAVVGTIPRLAGFFVEGGPFGVYLVGAILIQITRYVSLRYIGRREFLLGGALLLVGLVGAQSKSAVLLASLLLLYYFYVTKRVGIMLAGAALLLPVVALSNLSEGVSGYVKSRERVSALAAENPDDYNLVMGRVMASVLLPRIVAEHPVAGVGIGNYSLVRNDPEILRGLPTVNNWDLHGLGLLGYAAELGIPLTLYAIWLYAYPAVAARRSRTWIKLLGAYPVLAAIFGVQLNFAYPWVFAGIVLSAIAIERTAQPVPRPAAALAARRGARPRLRLQRTAR